MPLLSVWAHDTMYGSLAQELRKQRPSLKLLYITPEQLVASTALVDVLQQLMRRNLLARFVVDEVTRPQMLTKVSHQSVHVVLILTSLKAGLQMPAHCMCAAFCPETACTGSVNALVLTQVACLCCRRIV